MVSYPKKLGNWIGGEEFVPVSGQYIEKKNPHDGSVTCEVPRSTKADVDRAVKSALCGQVAWAAMPAVKRGEILFDLAFKMQARENEIAEIVALETGKSKKDALGETKAAIAQALFMAGEGQRFFGRSTVSGVENRYPVVVREPVGVCGLIIAANTPIANVAWKVMPALICGNGVVLKASEDTPLTAWIFSQIAATTALPRGVFNVVHGLGAEAGQALVENPEVPLISFTGSTRVGKMIAETAGKRLAKICLELGGKNALVVCDDADIDNALKWVLLSSFSNAGQRCAASSRILIFESIYDKFRDALIEKVAALKVGPADTDDYGAVINQRQLENMLASVSRATEKGARLLIGGKRLSDDAHRNGYYVAPTVLENVEPEAELSCQELFGPITALYPVKDLDHAIRLANQSEYGLTAAIHTRNYHRAFEFARRVQSGVASINAGTHGSEPHMPFGGVKNSGNGGREPGPEALDVYSNIKVIYHNIDPRLV